MGKQILFTSASHCNGRFSLLLSKFQCCVIRSFECHHYSGIQKVPFCCSFCKALYLRVEMWDWFEALFIEFVEPSGRNPFSYPILEGTMQTLRLTEQTSPNSPCA